MAEAPPGPEAQGQGTDVLFASLYEELRRLAEHHVRGGAAGTTLGTTTLLHEAYLRMRGRDAHAFADRRRFFAYASRAMRAVVIDHIRARRSQKRGGDTALLGGEALVELVPAGSPSAEIDDLAAAMSSLESLDPELAELVDLHAFSGFSLTEIAGIRAMSERTVQRDWRKARLLLRSLLSDSPARPDATA